jgi:hypothetical protein
MSVTGGAATGQGWTLRAVPGTSRRRFLRAAASALGACALASMRSVLAQDPRAVLAQDAARDWLAIVDRGDVAGSWQAAGERFRQALDAQRWKQALSRVRTPLGAVLRRTVLRTSFTDAFAGAPRGDYAVVQFRTSWQNKADGIEQVTLEHGTDGRWHVVGYVIQ